jgi:hypothetical protein
LGARVMRVEKIGLATQWTRIYALCEADWTPRYVGKTVQFLHERHKAHIRDAIRGRRLSVHYWLRKRMAVGAPLCIQLIENVELGADWRAREMLWIAKLREEGADLLNLTEGGEGLPGHSFSEAHKQAIAARLRTGIERPCEVCAAPVWAKRNQIAKGQARFCSRACANHRHKGRSLFDA